MAGTWPAHPLGLSFCLCEVGVNTVPTEEAVRLWGLAPACQLHGAWDTGLAETWL